MWDFILMKLVHMSIWSLSSIPRVRILITDRLPNLENMASDRNFNEIFVKKVA